MRSRNFRLLIKLIVFLLIFQWAAGVLAQDEVRVAVARLYDVNGNLVGSVSLTQSGANVVVVVQVNDLPPGVHGFHIHTTGQCDPAGETPFASAGDHFNPGGTTHPDHAGDLPALLVLNNGTGLMTAFTDRFAVADLLDADGSAIIIHADPDNFAHIPDRYGVTPDEQTLGTGDGGAQIACGMVETLTTAATSADTLAALQALPYDLLPATVSREANAEQGSLVMTLAALNGAEILSQITSGDAGQIGEVTREGDILTFTFTEITYTIAPISLPGGFFIGEQSIALDPSQPSTMQVNLTTGEVTRNFHWIMTATDVLYDGQPSVGLGDTAAAEIVEIQQVSENVYAVRLVTHWKTSLTLTTWTIGGTTMPSGQIDSAAEFDGTYIIDFTP